MGVFSVLFIIFGACCVATATGCIPETERCSIYWEKTLPHKDLIATEDELNLWCSKQAKFFECLEDVLLEGKNGNISYLPTNLLISKLYVQDICSDGSTSRTRLLSSADCINQLDTDFCILPEYLDIVTPDDAIPSTRCSQAEKTFSCVAATIVLNCGFDAGRVYRTMLKITRYSDEVCGIETSEGIPPCEGTHLKSADREKELSEIYYGLFHRIGNLIEDGNTDELFDSEPEENFFKRVGEESVSEAIQNAIGKLDESQDELPDSESEENLTERVEESVSEAIQSATGGLDKSQDEIPDSEYEENLSERVEEAVSEAIQSAIDSLDENAASEECDTPECEKLASRSRCEKDAKEYKPYMKNPHITEVFREILFYNYSGIEYALYWRQPEFTVMDRLDCEHLQASYMKVQIFRCKNDYRYNDPACVSNATVHEKVTPEFIRRFDPEVPCDSTVEFGPKPEFMHELDTWYEEKRIRDQTETTTQPTTDAPEIFTTGSTLLHLAATASSKKDPMEKWWEYDLKANNMNSPFPNDIHEELVGLLLPDMKSYVPPPMHRIKIGDSAFLIMYNPDFAKSMENITCSRIDECHPDGRGLWKCKVWPRKIEECDTCGKIPTEEVTLGYETYARPAKPSESKISDIETEPAVLVDGSGEATTMVFSDENESSKSAVEYIENEVESLHDLHYMNDESETEDENESEDAADEESEGDHIVLNLPDTIDESALEMLTSILKEENPELFEIDGVDSEDNESEVVLATEDGLLPDNILLIEGLSDKGEAKYTLLSTPGTVDAV